MVKLLEEIDFDKKITKMDLLYLIKKEANSVHIQEIMRAAGFLRKDAQYMPLREREDYVKRFSKAFFIRIRDIKEDKKYYSGYVPSDRLKEFLEVLELQEKQAQTQDEKCFQRIAQLVATYTTFIREESIHPVGTKFPGGFVLRKVNDKYLCPVKNKQLNTPSALCRFCVSIQDEEVE